MMTLAEAFATAKDQHRPALIPYITAGYPQLSVLPELIGALREAGADAIEIGIPFSDPLADGPVLQRAATEAIRLGTKVRDILSTVEKVSKSSPPLLFLSYINPIFHFGSRDFIKACQQVGIQGLIIPDLPWAESEPERVWARESHVSMIPFVAPTSTEQHMAEIADADGFVYLVSVTGVTGARTVVADGIKELIVSTKAFVPLPVAVGFGISTPEQAHEIGQWADGVIVGSALMKKIADRPQDAPQAAYQFLSEIRQALPR